MNLNDETNSRINDGSKPYDLTMIYAISDNNPEFLNKLLLMFSDTVFKDMQLMKTCANDGNWSEVGQIAHKMKTSLTHFGVNSVKEIIRTLEHPGHTPPGQLNLLVLEMEKIVNDVLFNLREEFPGTYNT